MGRPRNHTITEHRKNGEKTVDEHHYHGEDNEDAKDSTLDFPSYFESFPLWKLRGVLALVQST